MKLNVVTWIISLVFVGSALGGVGHGNPSTASFVNPQYAYTMTYSTTDYAVNAPTPELASFSGIAQPSSQITVQAETTQITTLSALRDAKSLGNCAQGTLGKTSGFHCDGSYVLLVPTKEIITIRYSNDDQARAVVGTFSIQTYERLPLHSLNSPTLGNYKLLSVFASDQKLLLQTEYALSIVAKSDLHLISTIHNSGLSWESCHVNPARTRVLCDGDGSIQVWDLTTTQRIGNFATADDGAVWIDDQTIAFHDDGADSQIYTFDLSSNTAKLAGTIASGLYTYGQSRLSDAFTLGQSHYLVLSDRQGVSVLAYPSLTQVARFDGAKQVAPLADGSSVIVGGSSWVSRVDLAQASTVWTIQVPNDEFSQVGFAVGQNSIAINDYNAFVHFYDLTSGTEHAQIMDGGLGREARELVFGQDGSTLYRVESAIASGSSSTPSIEYVDAKLEHEIKRVNINAPGVFMQSLPGGKIAVSMRSDENSTAAIDIYSATTLGRISGTDVGPNETLYQQPWINSSGTLAVTLNSNAADVGVSLYDLHSGKQLSTFNSTNWFNRGFSALPDGKTVLGWADNGQILEIGANAPLHAVVNTSGSDAVGFRTDLNATQAVTWTTYGSYSIWDIQKGSLIFSGSTEDLNSDPQSGNPCAVTDAEFRHTDEILLYTKCGAVLRSTQSAKNIKFIPAPTNDLGFPAMRLSPDESLYVYEDANQSVGRVVDSTTGQEISEIWGSIQPTCMVGMMNCLGLYSWTWTDGNTIATSGVDSTLRLWKVR